MSKNIHDSLTELVGNTPLVRLHGYEKKLGLKAHLLAKVEYFNPIGSIKDRIVLRIIEDAEREGKIKPGVTTLVEYTSGNTGIAVSAIGAMKGYDVTIYLQDGTSQERFDIMKAYKFFRLATGTIASRYMIRCAHGLYHLNRLRIDSGSVFSSFALA